VIQGQLMS